MNNPEFSCSLTRANIQQAFAYVYHEIGIEHTDAPGERDLLNIRDRLPCRNSEMLSLNWLRNEVVKMRKASNLRPEQMTY